MLHVHVRAVLQIYFQDLKLNLLDVRKIFVIPIQVSLIADGQR